MKSQTARRITSRLTTPVKTERTWNKILNKEIDILCVGAGGKSNTNMGDSALALAHEAAFEHLRVNFSKELQAPRLHKPKGSIPKPSLLIGGGTLIGHPKFRKRLEVATNLYGRPLLGSLGTGVESCRLLSYDDRLARNEALKWARLLADVPLIGVRGPDSQASLESLGIPSTVTADPALLLGKPSSRHEKESGRILINTGVTGRSWHNSKHNIEQKLISLTNSLRSRGWDVAIVSVWPPDNPSCSYIAQQTNSKFFDASGYAGIELFNNMARESDIVIGLKLHAVVLAIANGTPAISISYRPKCLDFMKSMGVEDFSIRSDRLSPEQVTELTEFLTRDADQHRRHLDASVSAGISRLQFQVKQISDLCNDDDYQSIPKH